QAIFFGLGSDGTVGANKAAAAIIGERTEFYSQGHFNYSSQKAGASTVSHLRFGPKPIRSEYEIESSPGADYVACHHTSFLSKFDMLSKAREGAAFVVNCPWKTVEELDQEFPAKLRQAIAEKKVELYTIDAHAVASSVGLPAKRINQVMQATFFNLSGILPPEDAKEQLEGAIDRMYGKKSPEIVRSNKAALAAAPDNLNRINYPSSWLTAEDNEHSLRRMNPSASPYSPQLDEFSSTFLKSIDSRTADELAVSAFSPGGETPIGQSTHQKRALADEVPVWLPDKCTQCNLCSVVCPHAVVRPFLLDKKEMEAAPEGFVARKAKGGDLAGLNYTIQLAPFDCTGCAVCVEMCPDDALIMESAAHSQEKFNDHWEYSLNTVSVKDNLMERGSVKGSQFQEPLIEFSGACSGCGETPYVKLLTQMFGDRMVIANSSGCSSVWGGSYGLSPFKKNRHGQGPAWARSLFEDTAEYGLGMALGSQQRRERLVADVKELLEEVSSGASVSTELQNLMERWIEVAEDAEKCTVLQGPLKAALAKEPETSDSPVALGAVKRGSDLLVAPSHWIIGGDGWAYDIGFGGLDHVLATGQNINVLVLDTEGYSNTGAQNSKATPKGATMKMSAGGNRAKKKDLGAIAMMHENAYVASVSLSADVNQTVKAFKEAEAYPGPSIIIAYATCVDWGHRAGDKAMVQQQVQAVESGYWPLYRYNPDKVTTEHNGFELDNKRISPDAMDALMRNENRFTSLQRTAPEFAKMLQSAMKDEFHARHEARRRKAMADEDLLEYLKKCMGEQVTGERVTVLYGTDTGNAEMVAKNFQFEFKRRGMKAKCLSLNDMPISDLAEESKVLAIVATAGQGEMPKSAVKFWQDMETFLETAPADYLKDTKFAVFGLGDSSYVFFNEAAKRIDTAFEKLGGQRVQSLGLGDDQHPGRFDDELEEWSPDFYDNIEAPEPPQELSPPSHLVEVLPPEDPKAKQVGEAYVPVGSKPVKMTVKRSTVPEGYERAIDHFEFDLTGSGLSYEQGDSLGLWPSNPKQQVDMCLMALNMKGDEILHLRPVDSNRSVPLPEVITVRTLLTEVLDIAGWPKRRFYEMLKLSATDAKEKEITKANRAQTMIWNFKLKNSFAANKQNSRSQLQHEEQMKHSYMETRRENLRDLLSETLDEAQSTVLKSTLLFGFVVAVLVEGFPSPENSNERYIDIFIFSVSWAICLLFQSIVLAGLYQVVQTRALREMIRNLQASATDDSSELRRSNTMDSGFTSLSDGWADLEGPGSQEPRRPRLLGARPYSLMHPSSQRLTRHKTEESNSFGSQSTKDSGGSSRVRDVPTLHVFDPKRLLYRSQAKKFVTVGSLFTLICLAGLIYGRLSMRRGNKHGEGVPDVLLRLGIFLPPFVSATFSLLLRKNANPNRSTLAVQSLAWLCFFVWPSAVQSSRRFTSKAGMRLRQTTG
ncbi:Pyruvate dehydrogenase [NADP(+)], partial [Durusdinium trenchii]